MSIRSTDAGNTLPLVPDAAFEAAWAEWAEHRYDPDDPFGADLELVA